MTENVMTFLKVIPGWLFPSILILLNVCSAIIWACHGDIRKMVYWGAAAVLTIAVTF